jgi:hypothetical protein
MKNVGGFVGNLLRTQLLPKAVPIVKFRKWIPCNNPPAPMEEIDAALTAGMPVIIKVDFSPDPNLQEHWILLVDKMVDDYILLDPWRLPGQNKTLRLSKSRYNFAGGANRIILDTIFFTGKPLASELSNIPIPPNPLVVYAATDDLALRSQPKIVDETLIDRMKAKTRLYCLDAPEIAAPRVGQKESWLPVQRDEDGLKGYVYALYLSLTPDLPAEEKTGGDILTLQTDGLVVYATGDALALRSEPVIKPETLIKRVPLNTQFAVLDPPAEARLKIGVKGQWLKVKDVLGAEGYVAAWYLSTVPQAPILGVAVKGSQPEYLPGSADALVVRTTADALSLRSKPEIDPSTYLKSLPFATDLLVLEPVADALLKVGVTDQWLKVRDITGSEGYVAAWYVVKAPLPPSIPDHP